jgi:hypothetical protein
MEKKQTYRNSRLQVMVTEETYAILSEIAELTKESMSSTVADLLQSLTPGLKKQLFILRKVHKLKTKEREVIKGQLEETEKKLQQDIDKSFEDIDNVLK